MNKVALVTGSSRGIGRAIAERLGADGMSVVVNYRADRAAADEVVAKIEASGGRATAVQADVTDPRSCATCSTLHNGISAASTSS